MMKIEEVGGARTACGTPDRRLERRRAMIEAAESLFLEQGYDATRLAAIVMSDAQLRMLVEGDASLLCPAALDWRLAPFLSHFGIE
jgi:hypothetical protein